MNKLKVTKAPEGKVFVYKKEGVAFDRFFSNDEYIEILQPVICDFTMTVPYANGWIDKPLRIYFPKNLSFHLFLKDFHWGEVVKYDQGEYTVK